MSDYRYLLFPRGNQPATGEVAELQNYAGPLLVRFAVGTERKTNSLAIAFEAEAFERALQAHAGFRALIHQWERRGATVLEHLSFVKDSQALRPVPANQNFPGIGTQFALSGSKKSASVTAQDKLIAAKELAAREALGRSLLGVQQTIQRHRSLESIAAWAPYLLIAAGSLLTIAAGTYTYQRLQDSRDERRKETIERVTNNPMQENLDAAEE